LDINENNIDTKFSNGYLLGFLLRQLNQITALDFNKDYKDSNHKEAKLNNFVKVQKVLRTLGIKLCPTMASNIILNKSSEIQFVLLKLKSFVEDELNSKFIILLYKLKIVYIR